MSQVFYFLFSAEVPPMIMIELEFEVLLLLKIVYPNLPQPQVTLPKNTAVVDLF
jgi:hypothetical protein